MLGLEDSFTKKVFFSDESAFSYNRVVNSQNVRIWGSELPSDANQEYDRNAPELNVFCAMNGF